MGWFYTVSIILSMFQVAGSLSDQEQTKEPAARSATGSLSDSNSGNAALPTAASSAKTKALLPEVREELLARVKRDQAARGVLVDWLRQTKFAELPKPVTDPKLLSEFKKIGESLSAVDKENLAFLKKLVEKHGWLSRTLVDIDGAKAAWLILQHADSDREFQKECLKVMKGLPAGEVDSKDIAYLTDRILVGEGEPQIYGTQVKSAADGGLELAPLFEPIQVDDRRRKMGLGPLQEYLDEVRKHIGS